MTQSSAMPRLDARPDPIGPGAFVAVMGPSGSGKDTLIAHARDRVDSERTFFVRRIVTRAADSAAEDHDTMSCEAFAAAEADGAFALCWKAHGLDYGLPAGVDAAIRDGRAVVANVSRAVLPLLRQRYRHVVPVHVFADPDILAARIARRGRESGEAIAARVSRDPGISLAGNDIVRIDNGGELTVAVDRFVAAIEVALRQR
ncbi:MAG: phosphonate metabolism protein/1,5-bisphosphokinase (PRPP-forming) PhnN [Pseudomonadota bacterium]